MTAANTADSAVVVGQPSTSRKGVRLFLVMLAHWWNLFLLYFLMPRILTLFDQGVANKPFIIRFSDGRFHNQDFSIRLFTELAHFVHAYALIVIPLLFGFAVWNGWAVCSTGLKLRKRAWRAVIGLALFSAIFFALTAMSMLLTAFNM